MMIWIYLIANHRVNNSFCEHCYNQNQMISFGSGLIDIIFTSAKEVMLLPHFVCLFVCQQDNSKSYGRIFLKFWGYVGNGTN